MAFLFMTQPAAKLGCRTCLTRALQADQHDFNRRFYAEVELTRAATHHFAKFRGDELDEMLLRAERLKDFLTQRPLLYVLDEVANDFEVDVCFEQCEANLAQRIFDIALGYPALAR